MSDPVSVIELQSVAKKFGSIQALNQVNLSLNEGEFFALLGPSGCGKTTLLRVISGFEPPDSGSLLLDGKDITSLKPNKRPINMMFQSYALFPHLDVFSNIAYGLEMENLPRAEINERVDKIVEKTQLQLLIKRKPEQLSGGQRQRVALARALVKQPRVLLLDEPLAALDRKLKEQMQFELKRLQHEFGITFVVVTHDQDEAMIMADRIALMNDGEIAQLATPQELYEQPVSVFVADFIGISSFVPGTWVKNELRTSQHGSLKVGVDQTLPDNTQAVISLRPDQLSVSTHHPLSGYNAVCGRVADVAYRGQDISLVVNVTDCPSPVIVRLSPAQTNLNEYSIGQTVWCNWLPERGRLLAAQ